jgi:hypothetical protein
MTYWGIKECRESTISSDESFQPGDFLLNLGESVTLGGSRVQGVRVPTLDSEQLEWRLLAQISTTPHHTSIT